MKTRIPAIALAALVFSGTALADTPPINVNEADAVTLEALNGVGPATATAIIEERETNGPFETIDSLTRVRGIGDATLEEMRDQITLE